MGVCVHYWAIPPQSDLYIQLERNLAFNTLMLDLISYDRSLYNFFEIEVEEVEETIDDLLDRYQLVLGPEPQRTIDLFFAEIEKTRIQHPGIERRVVMIEKCTSDIENRMSQVLRDQLSTDSGLITRVVWGDAVLHPTLAELGRMHQPGENILGLISPSCVQEGAKILARLHPQQVFSAEEDLDGWYRENYERWRQVYLDAASHNEAILVGVS